MKYGVNLDITKYTNGKRETLNPEGRAHPPTVWDFYEVIYFIYLINMMSVSYISYYVVDLYICILVENLRLCTS